MKFAKELERDLVPEWRIKYLNYKAGKKHIKAIARAINRANSTPSLGTARRETAVLSPDAATPSFVTPASRARDGTPGSMAWSPTRSVPIQARRRDERQSLTEGADSDVHYGSIVPTPPDHDHNHITKKTSPFELPDPAIRMSSNTSDAEAGTSRPPPAERGATTSSLGRLALHRNASSAANTPPGAAAEPPGTPGYFHHGATFPNLTPSDIQSPRAKIRKMLTLSGPRMERYRSRGDYDVRALDEVHEKETEFYEFLDHELDKVETFYKQKEEQAARRLTVLREQLHEMRDRRTSEIEAARRRKQQPESNGKQSKEGGQGDASHGLALLDPLRAKLFKLGPNSEALSRMVTQEQSAAGGSHERRDYTRRPDHDDGIPYRTAKRKLKLALQEFYRGLELLKSYALLNRTAFRKLNKKYDKSTHARPPYRYMTTKVNKSWFVNSDALDTHLQAVEDLYARYFERGNHKIAAGKLRSLGKKKRDESGSTFQNGLFIGVGAVFTIQGLVYGAELLVDEDELVRDQTSYLMQIYGGYFLMLYLFSMFCLNCKLWTSNRVNYHFIFEFDARSQLDWRQLAQFPSFFTFLFGLFFWLNFTRYSPDLYLYYPIILIALTFIILFAPAPILFHKSRKWFLYSHWRLFFAGLYPVEFRDFFLGDMYCSLTYAMSNVELFFCLYVNDWNNPQNCNSNHSRVLGFLACLPPIWRFLQCIRRYKDTGNIFPHLVNCGKYTASILAGVFLSVYRINNTSQNLALFIAFATVNGIYTAFWDVFMDFSLLQPHSRHPLLRDITALKYRWPYYLIMVLDPILRFSWIFYAIFTHNTQHSSIASFLIAFAEVTRRGMWTLLRVENEHCANVKQYKASRDVPLPYHLHAESEATASSRSSVNINAAAAGTNIDDANSDSSSTARTGREGAPGTAYRDDADNENNADNLNAQRPPSVPRTSWTGAILARTRSSARSTGVSMPSPAAGPDLEAGPASGGRTPGEESLGMRRRRPETVSRRSIRAVLADAHKQDFEKKRKPSLGVGSRRSGDAGRLGLGGQSQRSDDDDDDDDEDLVPSDEVSDEETIPALAARSEFMEAILARQGRGHDNV